MLKMKKKVTILTAPKADGCYNVGVIIGVELQEKGCYLGYASWSEFLARFSVPRYKVAYVDCVTKKACTEWFQEADLI